MRYWWVSQNQTYKAERAGGYLWCPKRRRDGARNQFYAYMREVSPGDTIFSYVGKQIVAVSYPTKYCYEANKPTEDFGRVGNRWSDVGWRIDADYFDLERPFHPKDHIDSIRSLLPEKYSPLRRDGGGTEIYLTAIGRALGDLLLQIAATAGNDLPSPTGDAILGDLPDTQILDQQAEEEIVSTTGIDETEKAELRKSRRGQGRFRRNVRRYEKQCRITGVNDLSVLIASHIKPWRHSDNRERLDGENGLLLTPNVDLLFDHGFVSFDDNGDLLISPAANQSTLAALGVPCDRPFNCGSFTAGQKVYLEYHRREVFLAAN